MAHPNGSPDRARVEAAFDALLDALGVDRSDPNLKETPARAAEAWCETLLAGYGVSDETAVGETYPTTSNGAVLATRIPFISMCPHHLLPLNGQAHVAFQPKGRVPGFGRIARVVDQHALRLTLQEDLTRSIVDTLTNSLDVEAAVCVIEAQHMCVAVTDRARKTTRFVTTSSAGDPEVIASLTRQIDASLRESWRES